MTSSASEIEFFFDYTSPAAYLASTQIADLESRTGARVRWRPFFVGGLFKTIGNTGNNTVANKFEYTKRDMKRCADFLGVPFVMPPTFPVMSLPFLRWSTMIDDHDALVAFSHAIYKAIWADSRDLNDMAEAAAVLKESGVDPEAFMAGASAPEAKQALKTNTDEAGTRGAFGAPTFFVGDEIFWGHDRMDFIVRKLTGEAA